ncbi:hypothetical protein [Streptomyces sp. NPDC012508]|uniref:hypothetical protein n=1 Tax=Streptomyces sp. NPDC012508 TaxID=3364837 RepID=UPI0036976A00
MSVFALDAAGFLICAPVLRGLPSVTPAPDPAAGEPGLAVPGFYGTGVPVARTLGPLLVTALLVTWGVPGWLLLGGIFLLTGAAARPAVRWAERSRAHAPATHGATELATAH